MSERGDEPTSRTERLDHPGGGSHAGTRRPEHTSGYTGVDTGISDTPPLGQKRPSPGGDRQSLVPGFRAFGLHDQHGPEYRDFRHRATGKGGIGLPGVGPDSYRESGHGLGLGYREFGHTSGGQPCEFSQDPEGQLVVVNRSENTTTDGAELFWRGTENYGGPWSIAS